MRILLDESSLAVAARRAAERGLSVSGYIQELIHADDAAAPAETCDIAALVGILDGASEPTDIARDKHRMTAQAFADGFERRLRRRSGSA